MKLFFVQMHKDVNLGPTVQMYMYIWALTQENLSLGFATTRAQTSLHIHAVWSAPLLFANWKVYSYLDLLQAKFQFSS